MDEKLKKNVLPPELEEARRKMRLLRNKPCPCGSGKKTKLCHGRTI